MRKKSKAIITCAITGSIHTPSMSPYLPVTPDEIDRLLGAVERKGHTIVPLKLYWKNGNVKLEIGLAKGKKQFDKRHAIREREWSRDQQRLLRNRTG